MAIKSGLLWCCLTLILAWAGISPAPTTAAPPLASFGSERLLRGLWSSVELDGRAADLRLGPRTAPDLAPPGEPLAGLDSPPLPLETRGCIRSVAVPVRERVVALTFDLCELADQRAGYDYRIVNLLRREDIRATFFAGGHWLKSHPQAAQQLMADPRFEIGNHGWTHGNMAILPTTRRREQVVWTQAEYRYLREELARRAADAKLGDTLVAVPQLPRLFRLPYGRADREALSLLGDLGMPVIQWSLTADENARGDRIVEVAKDLAARIRPGGILLLHANGVPKGTAAILAELLPRLRQAGYRLVTVSELLQMGPPVVAKECYFETPGDNLQLDQIYGDGTLHPSKKP